MPVVVGVSFRTAGRIYSFDPNGLKLSPGMQVITETSRGEEFGEVKHGPRSLPDEQMVSPLKRVLRVATDEDLRRVEALKERAEQSLEFCRERLRARQLPMKLLRAEYAFDASQVTIYFTAEGRVDFRELVKDLAAHLRTRIQLHQVGARDAAKLLGGIGPCGRTLCCSTWLTNFDTVSMRMAKEQSLFLNPTKFSGVCGKLMCCLRFEYDHYRDTKARMPSLGAAVQTPDGPGTVMGHNVVAETLVVSLKDGIEKNYPLREVQRPIVRGCSVLAGGKCVGGCGSPRKSDPPSTQPPG